MLVEVSELANDSSFWITNPSGGIKAPRSVVDDQPVVRAAFVDEGIDTAAAGQIVIVEPAIQHVVELRPDDVVVAALAAQGEVEPVVGERVGVDVVIAFTSQDFQRVGVFAAGVQDADIDGGGAVLRLRPCRYRGYDRGLGRGRPAGSRAGLASR